MESDTDLARNEDSDLVLNWSGRWTLSYRILAVNVLTIVLIALVGRVRLPGGVPGAFAAVAAPAFLAAGIAAKVFA